MKKIETTHAPGAIGPYSQGYVVNGFVFTSGQIPVDPATGEIPAGIAAQTEQSCKKVAAILEAAGSDLSKVIKTTCFPADRQTCTYRRRCNRQDRGRRVSLYRHLQGHYTV